MSSPAAYALAPFGAHERDAVITTSLADEAGEETVCTPVPDGAEDPALAAARLYRRRPDKVWPYKDEQGRLLIAVARWDKPGGKEIRPLTWVRNVNGSEGWALKHHPSPRPLYNLDQLAAEPEDTVIVCEGEKTADAAALIFPEYVATTSPAGAYAAEKADWLPLEGRKVVIAPDANDPLDKTGKRPGDIYAEEVARQALQHGAAEVSILDTAALSRMLPDGSTRKGPQGWDLADALDEGWTPDALRKLLEGRPDLWRTLGPDSTGPSTFVSFGSFTMDPVQGLSVEIERRDDIETHFVSAPFEVLGRVRTPDGQHWARLLRWRDDDGHVHTHAVPDADLHGDVKALAASLATRGLKISTGKGRPHLAAYLNGVQCETRVTMVDHTGWHEIDEQFVFVLPDRSIGAGAQQRVILSSRGSTPYNARGSLEDWQKGVGRLVCGHSRLVVAVSAAFAGMLLTPTNLESGGLNLYGGSSIDKSTAAEAAASVYGRGASPGFVRSWRATANALEGAAALHTDTLLVLDELGVVEAKEAAAAIYRFVSGTGKGRSARDGSLRSSPTWRTMVLSTGEIRLSDKLRENNQRTMAGQAVRLIDIPADAGRGFGIFDHPGESGSAKDLADEIKRAAKACYGTAGSAFIERLLAQGLKEVEAAIGAVIAKFRADIVPVGADGQVLRAADRFGLIAAAGELARELQVVPWLEGHAYTAAIVCFRAWLSERGGTGAAEVEEAIARVRRFIEAHGQSRFENIGGDEPLSRTIINRAGFRRGSGVEEEWWVLPETWKTEVCAGLDPTRTARTLADRGMLVRAPDGYASVRKVGGRSTRVYVLTAKILAGGSDE